MKEQIFRYQNLALRFFYHEASIHNRSVSASHLIIYFPGLPQHLDKHFFEDKVKKDVAFFAVDYLGSHLSGGSFSFQNCLKSIRLALQFVKQGRGAALFDQRPMRWKYRHLHMMGYSFAGNALLRSPFDARDVESVILFAPLIYLYKQDLRHMMSSATQRLEFYRANSQMLEFLRRGYKNEFRGIKRAGWSAYFGGMDVGSRVIAPSHVRRILIVHGDRDAVVDLRHSKYFAKTNSKNTTLIVRKGVSHNLRHLYSSGVMKKTFTP